MIKEYGEPISVYTRQDAIEDGLQRDVTAEAREVGFRIPVTITAGVMEEIKVPRDLAGVGLRDMTEAERKAWLREIDRHPNQAKPRYGAGQDERGRLHDVLFVGIMRFRGKRAQLRNKGFSEAEIENEMRIVPFTVRFQDTPRKAHDTKMWLVFNEYEGFTIMTPSEY